jgi:hypothetical protein
VAEGISVNLPEQFIFTPITVNPACTPNNANKTLFLAG